MNTSIQPADSRRYSGAWWAMLFGIISGILTILYYAACGAIYCCGDSRCDVPVFVQDGHGVPVTNVVLRLENGKSIELDEGGNALIPKENIGKPVSVRDRVTGRECKVFLVPKIAQPLGALEIVVPGNGALK